MKRLPPLQPPEDDGHLVRDSGRWAKDKLEIVRCYLSGFTTAASRARHCQLVDGFAGPGIDRIRESDELVWGTPMVGARTEPPFTDCLFMDLDGPSVKALRERTRDDPRTTVRQGDVNEDLVPAMTELLNPRPPTIVLLDPEGPHLNWETVRALSTWRVGKTKTELLILLPTHIGMLRELPLEKPIQKWAERDFDTVFGPGDWRSIYQRRREGMDSADATTAYLRLYVQLLEGLGYEHVIDREVHRRSTEGGLLYFLIFATDHPAGKKIAKHCFDNVYTGDQMVLPGITPGRSRLDP